MTGALLLAGLLDIVENIALLTILFKSPITLLPLIAKLSALLKFMLILIRVIYALFGAVFSKEDFE